MSKDFYKTLGVERSASADDIKKAYRKLAMQHHPDRNKGNADAEAKFKEISEAYDILKDDQKKATYDRFGSGAFDGTGPGAGFARGGPAGGGGAGFGGFSDIFEDMFGDFMGGRGGQQSSGRGADIQYTLELTLEEAFQGKEVTIKIPLNQTCDKCNGSGAKEGTGVTNCTTCEGQGRVRQQQGFFTIERTCPACQGQGKTIKDPCDKCNGEGRQKKEKNLKAKIPAGVEHGRRIRLSGQGEAGVRGGTPGDLYVLISVKQHKLFRREGSSLHCRVPIQLTTAALGGEITIPTIEGAMSKVKIPAGTQTGQQFRLKGKGMSILNSEAKGDAFIEIFVETPVNLDKKQQDLLRQLENSISKDAEKAGDNKHSPESSGFFSKIKGAWGDLKD